jgi:hypothetical protein
MDYVRDIRITEAVFVATFEDGLVIPEGGEEVMQDSIGGQGWSCSECKYKGEPVPEE